MRFFQLHELNVGGLVEWLNDQIQASRLIPQQLRWDFFYQDLQDVLVKLYQDEARLLGYSFRLGISGTTVDTGLRLLSDPHILL